MRREQVPHSLDWTGSISIHPVLSFSALTPTLTHPHSSTLPRTPVSPALSALWGICISNRANSHSTVQSVSRSHLPLVFWIEGSACIQAFFFFLYKVQLQSKNMTVKNAVPYILIYTTSETPELIIYVGISCVTCCGYNYITIVHEILMVLFLIILSRDIFCLLRIHLAAKIKDSILIHYTQQSDEWQILQSLPSRHSGFFYICDFVFCQKSPVISTFLYFWLLSSFLLCLSLSVNSASLFTHSHPNSTLYISPSPPDPTLPFLLPTCLSLTVLVYWDFL